MKRILPLPVSVKTGMAYFILSTILQYTLTALHHAYGAWVYNTPWRMHILHEGLLIMIFFFLFTFLFLWLKKKILGFIALIVSGIVFGLAIGIYEGGYNHLLKNILFFSGAGERVFDALYFAPPYFELPNDFIFEVTGILQLVTGLVLLFYFVKAWQLLRAEFTRN